MVICYCKSFVIKSPTLAPQLNYVFSICLSVVGTQTRAAERRCVLLTGQTYRLLANFTYIKGKEEENQVVLRAGGKEEGPQARQAGPQVEEAVLLALLEPGAPLS